MKTERTSAFASFPVRGWNTTESVAYSPFGRAISIRSSFSDTRSNERMGRWAITYSPYCFNLHTRISGQHSRSNHGRRTTHKSAFAAPPPPSFLLVAPAAFFSIPSALPRCLSTFVCTSSSSFRFRASLAVSCSFFSVRVMIASTCSCACSSSSSMVRRGWGYLARKRSSSS